MDAGRLDRRITLEEQNDVRTDTGSVERIWQAKSKVWANRDDQRGLSSIDGATEVSKARTIWTIRHRSDVTDEMRVEHDGAKFEILSIEEFGGRGRYLKLASIKISTND